MSYSFHFTQFPTKEFLALWEDFSQGKLSARIDKKIVSLHAEREELLKSPTHSRATFYEDREEYIRCQKNFEAVKRTESFIESWEKVKREIAALEAELSDAMTEKEVERIAKKALDIFMRLFGQQNPFAPRILFVDHCEKYSDSARDYGYQFVEHLFEQVHGVRLDSMKVMPTNDQWFTMFQALKPEFVEQQLMKFFAEESVPPGDQAEARKEALRLLHGVKGLLKTCLDRGWDLWCGSEFQSTDVETKRLKELAKACATSLIAQKHVS